jgi:hypothetical protein
MVLYIVPPIGGKGEAPSKPRGRRRASICLTGSEADALSAALKGLHKTYTWGQLAELCGVSALTIRCVANGRGNGSPGLALRVARVAGISIDRVLTPGPTGTTHCQTCKRPL